MIHDIWTVVWKEWQEFRDQLLSLRRGGLSALILALILGVVAPVQLGTLEGRLSSVAAARRAKARASLA